MDQGNHGRWSQAFNNYTTNAMSVLMKHGYIAAKHRCKQQLYLTRGTFSTKGNRSTKDWLNWQTFSQNTNWQSYWFIFRSLSVNYLGVREQSAFYHNTTSTNLKMSQESPDLPQELQSERDQLNLIYKCCGLILLRFRCKPQLLKRH